MPIRKSSQNVFCSNDGTELFYRTWEPTSESQKAMILLHRGHEHSGRLQGLVDAIDLPDMWGFAFDARGHGESPGERGHAETFSTMVADLDCFVRMIHEKHSIPIENMVVVANSVGAVIAATWVHDYAPCIRGMVLAAPAFRIKLYVPLALPGLRLLSKIKRKSFIKSYIRPGMLTHDPEQAQAYAADPLITRDIAINILLGLHDTATRIMEDAPAITTPCMVMSAGKDYVVRNDVQEKFVNCLGSSLKEYHRLDDFYHAIFYEADRERPISLTRDFITRCFADDFSISLRDADKGGYTRSEYISLKEPAPLHKSLSSAGQKMSMNTLGKLSHGITLGLTTGFDSGESLDHVYLNKARGITPIGKLIDRAYLDAIGWKGIRIRKKNLKETVVQAIEELQAEEKTARVLDIASGPGRYLLELKAELNGSIEALLLRDCKAQNLERAKALASELELDSVITEEADAFNAGSYVNLTMNPNIAVVSGLFELFPENGPIRTALDGMAKVLEPGGYLVYTNQPWHPQVEMIARTLTNREGDPWIMRRRTQSEMDQLVALAGLTKLRTRVGPYGIFTVSIAQKMENTI